ncbi:MAG: aldose 1-epimerase family protein [Candidatus Sumerlaeaceae bacterium]
MNFGRDYDRTELRRHCGSTGQIARITSSELNDGREQGVRCLDFRTGSGFNFTVLPGRGMDIAFAEFRGRNLAWMSPTSIVAPEYYEPQGWNWIRGFFGGLLTTCGLVNVGVPDTHRNEPIGAHGRVSNTPASNVSYDTFWVENELHLVARGEMREVRPPHTNLLLRRTVHAIAGERRLEIRDRVINDGPEKTPHQILYHINAGFPVVSAISHFVAGTRNVTPRDDAAADAKELFRLCQGPTLGYTEKVYYHQLVCGTDGRCSAAVINPELDGGLGLYVKYDPRTLPTLVQWKMMGEGMYVLGLEPANTYGIGSERLRALGLLKTLEPEEQVEYTVEIGVLSGSEEIEAFEKAALRDAPTEPEYASILV